MCEVVSKYIALKQTPIVFQKKQPIVLQQMHFFIPLFWNEN